jgi:hypothetical protein
MLDVFEKAKFKVKPNLYVGAIFIDIISFCISIELFIAFLLAQVTILSLAKIASNKKLDASFSKAGFALASAGIIVLAIFIGYFENAVVNKKIADTNEYINITSLPEIIPPRIIPKQVADRFASDSFQNPQEKLTDSQIVMNNGQLQRVYGRIPEGLLLTLKNKLSGFVTVNVSSFENNSEIVDQEFKYSEGLQITDNLSFQLKKKRYFAQYSEPIYLKDPNSDQWYTAVPYISYKGFPIRIPKWGGVMIVDKDGNITDYTPEQAMQLPMAKNNRIYPKELSRIYTQAYSYKNGIFNKWFLHKDQIEIDENENLQQPYHLPTPGGYKQMLFTKPYGNSFGIYKVFIFDATTGKIELLSYAQNTQLIGPTAAKQYVEKNYPSIDYSQFSIVEPRPVTANNNLYWMFSIIQGNGSGIAHTVLVNAQTTEVSEIKDMAELDKFLNHGPVNNDKSANTSKSTDKQTDNSELKARLEKVQTELNSILKLINEK